MYVFKWNALLIEMWNLSDSPEGEDREKVHIWRRYDGRLELQY